MGALPFRSDSGPGERATFGLVLLRTDEALEGDMRHFLPMEGVALHHTRIPFAPQVTPETLARMQDDLVASVQLLPAAAKFDAIGYGCTSGTAVIGEDRVSGLIREVFPDARVSNPLTALKAALTALGVRRIALVTPYRADVTAELRERLSSSGFETATTASFDQSEDAAVARIAPESILEAVVSTGKAVEGVDAVVAACTNLRTAAILREAEARLGLPVLSSNQALGWHLARLAGLSDPLPALGRLGKLDLDRAAAA